MADETLFTAARRAVRNFNIDMNKGGLMTTDTEIAMQELQKQVEIESGRTLNAPKEGGE